MVVALIVVTDLNRIVQTGRLASMARAFILVRDTMSSATCRWVDRTPISPWQPFHALAYAIRRVHAPLHQEAAE